VRSRRAPGVRRDQGRTAEQALRAYQRDAAAVTDLTVQPPLQQRGGLWRGGRRHASHRDEAGDREAIREAEEVLAAYRSCIGALRKNLTELSALRRPRLLGKAEEALNRVEKADTKLNEARQGLDQADLARCGKAVQEAHRLLSSAGSQLAAALNQELDQAAFSRERKGDLQANVEERSAAQQAVERGQATSPRAALLASASLYTLMADGLGLAVDILGQQAVMTPRRRNKVKVDGDVRVIPPQDLETLADVGGLEDAKAHLRRTVELMLKCSDQGAGSGLVRNGILLHGPPGTGKTLLARALAGEYGLRFIRLSPDMIASSYQHEPAKKLRQVFARAEQQTPCLLFLDEVDTIGGRREATSSNHRELITQLLTSLEDYRRVPGLLLMAATNALDHLDPALREGRFDSRIAIPLPDLETRREILEVQLEARAEHVAWASLDLDQVAQRTSGRSGATLAAIVTGAAERALAADRPLTQGDLVAEIAGRSGQDRAQTVEERVAWADVVLPEAARRRLQEVLIVFQQPELGRNVGVEAPAGLLLHGPPGTGKTTVAKALAAEVKASFYEQSSADLLSKWVGKSEQKVAQLFARARDNRPSIIFCDEIDALLRSRRSESAAPWEDRVVSQFLQELDGLHSGEGVLLVGATNRPDIIDDAVRERRLLPIEIPLPDQEGRLKLLEVLCRDVRLGSEVDIFELAALTDGMSGADLKAVRNSAGMRALTRAAAEGNAAAAEVKRDDFAAVLAERGRAMPLRRAARTTRKATPKKATAKKSAAKKGIGRRSAGPTP